MLMCLDKTRPEEVRTSPARLAKAPRRVGGITGGFSKAWALALALGLTHLGAAAAGTLPGTVIANTASLSYSGSGRRHGKPADQYGGPHRGRPRTARRLP